jgi:hypothetical protein
MLEASVKIDQLVLPLTVEQETLACLQRIEKMLLDHFVKKDNPAIKVIGGSKPGK